MSNNIKEASPLSGGETAGKWTVLGIVAIGVFMATLDASILLPLAQLCSLSG